MKQRSRYRHDEYLFVDGYNIINSWSELKKISEVSLEDSRNELIDIMAEYKVSRGIEVVVVFDAHLVKLSSQKNEYVKGIEVVYTKEHQTADQYIEKELDDIGKIKKVRVATSDWVEQQVVLSRGGTRVSARELRLEIIDLKRRIDKTNKVESQVNEMLIGRLDRETIEKLNSWREDK